MRVLVLILCAALIMSCTGRASDESIAPLELENGLTALFEPIEGCKETALVVLYSIGGLHDPEGKSGLAHLIEHLCVTAAAGGEKARTHEEYRKRYEGKVNAQTGEDYTVLATVFPSKDLAKELEDAAARMGGLRVTDADVERERERIARELGNMFVGVPFLATFNHARERAVPSPGGARRAGVPEQMETITPEGVTARLEQYYKPGNALLILAGDINVDEAKRMISEHFGDLPAGEPVPAAAPRSLARVGAIEEILMSASYAASPPLACLAYAAPLPSDHLYAPFLVLTTRMWNRAMELGLDPGQFPVRFNPVDDPHVIAFQTQVGDGEGNDEAISRIRSFISSAILQGFQEEEIQTVRQTLAFFLGVGEVPIDVKRANPYGAAFGLGRRHQLGIDPPALVQQLEDLTSADVRRAGGTIFAPDKGAAVILRSSKKGVKSTD